MLNARITVDLPSVETLRRMGPIEWLQSLFGKPIDRRSGEEELTIGAFALVQALYRAFRRVGVTNAISFLIDKKVIYTDPDEVENDLDLIIRAAERAGIYTQRFAEMHLALAHRDRGLHTILDVKIHRHVMRGEAEMDITLSGRIEHLRIAEGETAAAYAERIRAFGQTPDEAEGYRQRLETLQAHIGEALRAAIPGAVSHMTPAQIRVIWPEARQIGRFRRLRFGADVSEPCYRPVPTRQQRGIYSDPYYHYYYDPYYDLTNWFLLDTLLHRSAWPSSSWHIVQSGGTPVLAHHATGAWASQAVRFDAAGDLQVDQTIPDIWEPIDAVERLSAWGSAEIVDSGGFGGADIQDTSWGGSDIGTVASSCGSSCGASGSSCGSSCGSSGSS